MKNELQHDLQDLQQHVEHHSSFQSDVWRRAVKRHSRQLYRKNLFSAIFLVVLITVSTVGVVFPWWLLVPIDLFLGFIVVEGLIAANHLRKTDAQSREGLLSLRESIQNDATYSKRKRTLILIVGSIIVLAIFIYTFFDDRDMFISSLFYCFVGSLVAWWNTRRIKKQNDEFGEEIDELLKE